MIDILREPDIVEVQTEESMHSVRPLVSFNRTSYGLQVYCQSRDEKVRFIILRWKGEIPGETMILGDASGEKANGHLKWKNVSQGDMLWWYFLASAKGSYTGYGVMTQPKTLCFWKTSLQEISLCMDVRCGGAGVMLGNRKLHVATLVSQQYTEMSSYQAAVQFCKKMCGYSICPKRPVYGFSNWGVGQKKPSGRETLEMAGYLASLAEELENRPYFILEDGWQEEWKDSYNGGPWRKGNNDFPDMKELVGQIRDKNLKAGIWFRPLLNYKAEVPKEACFSHRGILDPSHPSVLKLLEEDIQTMCGWGCTIIKHDFSSYDILGNSQNLWDGEERWHYYDEARTSAEIVMNFYHSVREAAGPYRAVVMGRNVVGHLGTGNIHIQLPGDIGNNPALWGGSPENVESLSFRLPWHKNFFGIASDVLSVASSSSWEENLQAAQLSVHSGIPLFLAVKPDILDHVQEKELRELLCAASKEVKEINPIGWDEEGGHVKK